MRNDVNEFMHASLAKQFPRLKCTLEKRLTVKNLSIFRELLL